MKIHDGLASSRDVILYRF